MSYSFFQASFPSVKSFAYFKNVQCIMHISFLFKGIMVSVFEDLNAWKIIEEEMWDISPLGIFWVSQNFHSCNQFPDELGRGRGEWRENFRFGLPRLSHWSWDQRPSILPRLCSQTSQAWSTGLPLHNLFLLQVLRLPQLQGHSATWRSWKRLP